MDEAAKIENYNGSFASPTGQHSSIKHCDVLDSLPEDPLPAQLIIPVVFEYPIKSNEMVGPISEPTRSCHPLQPAPKFGLS